MNGYVKGQLEAAKSEGLFSAQSLLEEIGALLNDYFVCDCRNNGGCIEMRFPNGQTFKLKAE